MATVQMKRFLTVLSAAIDDTRKHGYSDERRLTSWTMLLRSELLRAMPPIQGVEKLLRLRLTTAYDRAVTRGSLLKMHPGVTRFTLQRIEPHLRQELDRRILASASLIKLNRDEVIEKTLRRFAGWSTSIPTGGTDAGKKIDVKDDLKKALQTLPFVERRVLVDQGHKLISNISAIVADQSGAIAAKWHSNYKQAGYNYREEHKERDGEVYLIRDSWAHKAGFVKPGQAGCLDEITQPGEEVFCQCNAKYVTSLKGLPEDMLTARGRDELKKMGDAK